MGDINDVQINPEVANFVEHELMCPFCEDNFFSVETIITKDCVCDHYNCKCGNSWEVINK
jgi:hypothetical protein